MTIYHLILESTLGLTTFKFTTDYLSAEGLLPGFVDGYSKIHHDETRHIGYGVWFLRETVREQPEQADTVRQTLRDLLPSVAESLAPPDTGSDRDFAVDRRHQRGDPRVRARRPHPPSRDHRRAAQLALEHLYALRLGPELVAARRYPLEVPSPARADGQARVDGGLRHGLTKTPFHGQPHLPDAERPAGRLENPDHGRLELAVAETARRLHERGLLSPATPNAGLREGGQRSLKRFWRV